MNTEQLENMWLKFKFCNTTLAFCVTYRPPRGNVQQSVDCLDNMLSIIAPSYDNVMVVGDINVNMFNLNNNPISQCFDAYNMTQIINEPTRITNNSSTLIDPIFLTNVDICSNSGTINTDQFTDHQSVFCEICFIVNRQKQKMVTFRDYRNFNIEAFTADLHNIDWSYILRIHDIDGKIHFLIDNILFLMNKHCPTRTVRVSKPRAPWLTDNLKLIMTERDKALRKYKSNKTDENWNHYKMLRNFTLASVRREKAAYLQFLASQTNSSSFYKALKSMNIKNNNNAEIPSDLCNVSEINNFFLSVFTKNNNDCLENIAYYNNNKLNNEFSFAFHLVDTATIIKFISKIKSNASGSDGISLQIIKLCIPAIADYITHIMNSCLEQGYFPETWKEALVVPIPKTSNPTSYNELRPISLLTILSKILEKIVYDQINDYLSNTKLLPKHQSGFRKGHSTASALMNMSDNIITALDKKQATALVLLDFSKAFDTINHDLLIAKCKYFGFDQTFLLFLSHYLKGRTQRVVLNNVSSSTGLITSGVPQGSILGPILFLLYTSDLCTKVRYAQVQFFADDTQLYYHFNPENVQQATIVINNDLAHISNYAKNNSLCLNATKSKAMLFCHNKHRQILKSSMNILANGEIIPFVESAKNLGLYFDEQLRFTNHVSYVSKQCYVRLKLLFSNRQILSLKIKKRLCESLVLSQLTYCNIVYYPCLDSITCSRIQKIQNTCCRLIFNLRKYDHISVPFKNLGWLNVSNLYRYLFLSFLSRLLVTSTPPYLREKLVFRENIHKINIRHFKSLTMPRHRTAMFQRSFSYNAVKLYNFYRNITSMSPLHSFKYKIKNYLLSSQA